jgi:hypothetical protein
VCVRMCGVRAMREETDDGEGGMENSGRGSRIILLRFKLPLPTTTEKEDKLGFGVIVCGACAKCIPWTETSTESLSLYPNVPSEVPQMFRRILRGPEFARRPNCNSVPASHKMADCQGS